MAPTGNTITESTISLANVVTLGLDVSLGFQKPYQYAVDGELPDMSVTQTVIAMFTFEGTSDEVCLETSIFEEKTADLTNGKYVGWDSSYSRSFHEQGATSDEKKCFSGTTKKTRSDSLLDSQGDEQETNGEELDESVPTTKKKRQNNSQVKGDFRGITHQIQLLDLINKQAAGSSFFKTPEINCDGCGSCTVILENKKICCACAWLPPDEEFLGFMPTTPAISRRSIFENDMSSLHSLQTRAAMGVGWGTKTVSFWETFPFFLDSQLDKYAVKSDQYPAFPDYYRNPHTASNWDLSDRTTGVKKYFHNATDACDSFDVAQAATYDSVYPYPKTGYEGFAYLPKTPYHMEYQTEHVFEGQTISRFFTSWLPALTNGHKHEKTWTETYILSLHSKWPANAKGSK